MKHNIKVTIILLSMFLLAQFIGLYTLNFYSKTIVVDGSLLNKSDINIVPYGMDSPEIQQESDYFSFFYSIFFAFIIAIVIFLILTKINADFILKVWFFSVIAIALGISLNSFLSFLKYSSLIALFLALILSFEKVYRRNILIHNLTELLIYPGIAVIFVPILNFKTIIFLLFLISIYDVWAVWNSGVMQKMAKYQIDRLKVFSGFFIPYVTKEVKQKFAKLSKKELLKKKVPVQVAILGGGDVVFPIIASGVALKEFGFTSIFGVPIPLASILVIIGATAGLSFLLSISQKKKFYPAMPFISVGILLGLVAGKLFL